MADPNLIHIKARLTSDPELRATSDGTPLASFGLASSGRIRDKQTGQYVDGPAMYWQCTAWRQIAQNIAQSLHKGDLVSVDARPRMVEYTSKDGTHNRTIEWTVESISACLDYATVTITRNPTRTQMQAGQSAAQPAAQQSGTYVTQGATEDMGADPWSIPPAF